MLPTRYRFNVSKEWSYPVSAKQLSEALEGVPQGEVLELAFSPGYRLTDCWKQEGAYPLITVVFFRGTRMPDWPEWRIDVRPVPRTLKHQIAVLLEKEGLPRARSWLSTRPYPRADEGTERLAIWYDPNNESLRYEERQELQPEVIRRA